VSSRPPSREALIASLNALLREVSGLGVLYSQAAAARLGVNSTDLECLGYLADGPMTAGALAQATGLTTGAITGVIDRLERVGYARRERDAVDRRKVLVQITPYATQCSAPIFEPMAQATTEALSAYPDDQLALLLDFLERSRDIGVAALKRMQAESDAPAKKPRRLPQREG
jgi:DNA-binding MarR family transcriptional regulator